MLCPNCVACSWVNHGYEFHMSIICTKYTLCITKFILNKRYLFIFIKVSFMIIRHQTFHDFMVDALFMNPCYKTFKKDKRCLFCVTALTIEQFKQNKHLLSFLTVL